ncbi:glycosyltransferase family 4 protein [Brevundimonas sp. AJA228-03]|uniref:glycosyltransferase family 4 protein n=1 Tax=Brevundimonas sp. AJA228-03 TaxID=2752515 RepID=UPI001ADEF12E|nr:glycosyltransferase family 1 protein [Brevundimonas sp. AJA228-03]QTN20247.1 glycosyltransferase family 4 protein [Brevundimonas sp. AJA228-03]
MKPARPRSKPVSRSTDLFISVADLVSFLRFHTTLSGIQRVQANVVISLVKQGRAGVRFILAAGQERGFREIPAEPLVDMITYVSGAAVDRAGLDAALGRCEAESRQVVPPPGSTVILLGSFWGNENTIDRYIEIKSAGVRIGAYIYDLIPITHPQFCDAYLTRSFTAALNDLSLLADFFLTISDHTNRELSSFLEKHSPRPLPVQTVPLAHAMDDGPRIDPVWPTGLQRLKGRDYVAYVSTIEGRKNHLYVVNLWRQLIDEGRTVPDLLLAGRKGWRIGGLTDLLESTDYLDGRVHLAHGLSDADVKAVYAGSRFTVFSSFTEGWGLPVGESLAARTMCAASGVASILEVGGDFVDYFDPTNLQDGVRVIGRLIDDEVYLAARRRHIVEDFVARTWADVAGDFMDQVDELRKAEPLELETPTLRQGVLYRPSDLLAPPSPHRAEDDRATRFLIANSFPIPETIGAWMTGPSGELVFKTSLPQGEPLTVYLTLFNTGLLAGCTLKIGLDAAPGLPELKPIGISPDAFQTFGSTPPTAQLQVRGHVGTDGVCRLTLEIIGDYPRPAGDTRDLGLGLYSLGYAAVGDLAARTEILEALAFRPATQVSPSGPVAS